MAHPQHDKRDDKVSRSRARELTKGYATGGSVHSDVKEDKALIKKMVKPSAMKIAGVAPKSRMDRPGRASGGRVRKKSPQTNISINVTPPQAAPPAASAAPGGLPAPRPAPPPIPAPPPGIGGPGAPPLPTGLPPGGPLAMRAKGGRVKGAKPGPGWTESMKNETPVQHLPNMEKFAKRGKPITYADGGPVRASAPARTRAPRDGAHGSGTSGDRESARNEAEQKKWNAMPPTTWPAPPSYRKSGGPINAPAKGGMGPKMPGGGRGGLARLAKAKRAKAS